MKRVIVIGSGLGGLQCGYIMSKRGMKVTVLEKHSQAGGCLQSFRRGNYVFDTGFHYVGGLDEGQPLYRLFDFFGLTHLQWVRLDENGFDEVVFGDKSYLLPNGYNRFVDALAQYFPHQHSNLRQYTEILKQVGNNIFDINTQDIFSNGSAFGQSASSFVNQTITDPLLRNVLSGASLTMELKPDSLPLYTFAQINSSYIQSAWRLRGGSSQIIDSLVKSIENNGGIVRTSAEVTELIENNGVITSAVVNGEERLEADCFIADTHPSVAVNLVRNSTKIRKIFRSRINSLANTFGIFTVHLALKPNTVRYRNRNIHIHKSDNVWKLYDYIHDNINAYIMLSFQPPNDNSMFTNNIDILTIMYSEEVEQWRNTTIGKRGADYSDYKRLKADACVRLAAEYLPELNNAIDRTHSSSSLTWRDYTGSPNGSAYGIRKDCNALHTTVLSPRTPIPNLLLTGQNLNVHGILGVSMTAFLTCNEPIPNPCPLVPS
ncbi:MAG: NAD(P)/FAD-dependent oxidoreductase [Tannerella sp.]|jgi:all-trans-retinol 13,14-reductase|nr:NAD(P)/FAD-dependent oxidoreductase [Tannerella sp.]